MFYTLSFFSSKCSLFYNANLFGSYIIHILYTGCAKIKKNNSGAKKLITKIKRRSSLYIFFDINIILFVLGNMKKYILLM